MFSNNENSGLRLEGAVFETIIINLMVGDNGGALGTYPNAEFAYNNSTIHRLTWIGGGLNHISSLAAGNPATVLAMAHVKQVNIIGVNFESGDPHIDISGALTESVTIRGCAIHSSYAATSYIKIADGKGIEIDANSFYAGSFSPTHYIYQSATAQIDNISHINITDSNTFNLSSARPISLATAQTISSGNINAYRSQMSIETEGAAASDDLNRIGDHAGVALFAKAKIAPGTLVTINPLTAGHAVVVKHGTGNIYLSGHKDFTMSSIYDYLTLQWRSDPVTFGWFEYSRSSFSDIISSGTITALASGTTVTPTGIISRITGTVAIVNIAIPFTGFNGTIEFIPDDAFTTTTAGNIALASTAVANRVMRFTFDSATLKWYPSY